MLEDQLQKDRYTLIALAVHRRLNKYLKAKYG
jgi:hypothetical protein